MMDRKMTVAAAVKRVPSAQQKGKVSKPKTIGSKVKPKGVTAKRTKPGVVKVKGKPAPHVEPGYSLYSVTSDDSVAKDNDTSMEVLKLLRERKKEGKIKGNDAVKIPFNNRLSSSTPDPERLSLEKNGGDMCQMIPERDTSTSLWKETLLQGAYQIPTQVVSNHQNTQSSAMPPFAFYSVGAAGLMGSNFPQDVGVPQYPLGNNAFYDSHRNYYQTGGNTPVLTLSQGFVPSQDALPERGTDYEVGRQSDPAALQAYIQRESTGFVPVQSHSEREKLGQNEISGNDKSSSSKGTCISTTPNTSRSGYITLPQPQGNQKSTPHPNTKAVLSNENGLYQIRAQNTLADQNRFQNLERYITGQSVYPTPVSNSSSVIMKSNDGKTVSTDGSYLQSSEVPEKDSTTSESHCPPAIPLLELHETLSSINGSDLHEVETPVSQKSSLTGSGTPGSQATPKNSSSSNSSKSVHFSLQKDAADESSNKGDHSSVKGNSLRTCETQTDSVNTDSITVHSGTSGQSMKTNVLIPTGQGHFIISQGDLQQIPASLQMAGAFLQQTGVADQSTWQSSSGVSSSVPNPWSQVKTDAGLKKLRYFLKELKECGKINKDVEIGRLVKEIEKTLETIPQLKSTFSLQAEIDLAIQPLRNENAQLRRRLRLLGQYTKEAESEKDKGQSHVDFETLQLQASNTALKRQLNEEKEKMVKMAAELADTHSKLQKLQTEKNKLVTSLSERQTTELQIRQECLSETQKLRGELDKLQRQIRASQIKQQAVERENHILQITVQQRDSEIERQQEIVEAIKDSVSQLLQELEMSRAGADKSYLSTSSFNLQKILHILDKEHGISHDRSIRSDPGSVRVDQRLQPRLTAEVLASHNEKVCRQRGIMGEDIRGSTSDTEVEFMEREENIRKKSPKMRRRSISTDGQLLHDFRSNGHMRYQPQAEFRKFGQFYPSEAHEGMQGHRAKGQGHSAYRYDSFPNTLSQYENLSDVEQSKVSAVESRYSVTDYFRKYNTNKPAGALMGSKSINRDRSHLRSVSFRDQTQFDNINHKRSLSQPETHDIQNFSTQQNIPAQRSSNYRDTIGAKSKLKSPQEKLFTGTVLDNSISAIDDDNISSVSEKTLSKSTTSTFDDKSFRKGIATLDANILKLQLALQKTKSMLT